MRLKILLAIALLLTCAPASAWWDYGHQTVARIAELSARPATIREVRSLLKQAKLLQTPECPIRTIEDAAVWPDCIKKDGARFSYTFPWHYQNVGICKPFDLAAPCADGNCISAQIERNAKLLADRKLPVRERVMALAFLVHLVGDLHMPLHAGDNGDRGGNGFAAAYGAIGGKTNLHTIWDGYLSERAISTPPAGAAAILNALSIQERERMKLGSVTDWSRESWEAAREQAYGSVRSDPCDDEPKAAPVVGEATTQRLIPVVRRQIALGGLRLARLLDEALG